MTGSLFFRPMQALINPVPFTSDIAGKELQSPKTPVRGSGANAEQVSQSALGLSHFPSGQSVLLSS